MRSGSPRRKARDETGDGTSRAADREEAESPVVRRRCRSGAPRRAARRLPHRCGWTSAGGGWTSAGACRASVSACFAAAVGGSRLCASTATRRGADPKRHASRPECGAKRVSGERPSGRASGGRRLPRGLAPRPRHADPPARRLRPRRGGAARGLRRGASSSGRATACPRTRAPGSCRPAASRRSTRMRRRARFDASLAELAEQHRRRDARRRATDDDERRGRPAAADLHLLPPGAAAGRAGRADPARGLRPHDRGDRARLPHRRAHDRAAHRARQGEDPRRAHPLPGAVARRACRSGSTRCCASSTSCSTRATRRPRASR